MHHIGIISKNIEQDRDIYIELGYRQMGEIIDDPIQHNRLLFLEKDGDQIELIQAKNEQSTVANCKEGIHHFCYEVDNIEREIAHIKEKKLGLVFTKVMEAPAFDNRKIVFAYLKTKVIVEILNKEETP